MIKNSVEATSEGGSIGIVSASAPEKSVDGVLVQIVDNGSGIPEQIKPKLFSPFSSSKQENGSGLGLWISRAILEKHNGSIQVSSGDSCSNLGTTVSIFLPRKVSTP